MKFATCKFCIYMNLFIKLGTFTQKWFFLPNTTDRHSLLISNFESQSKTVKELVLVVRVVLEHEYRMFWKRKDGHKACLTESKHWNRHTTWRGSFTIAGVCAQEHSLPNHRRTQTERNLWSIKNRKKI